MNTPSTMQSRENDLDEIDLKVLFHDLWAHKWLILGCMLVFLIGAGLYALKLAPQYQSSVLLQIESKPSGLSGISGGLSSVLGNDGGSLAATQIALIQSRFILEPVIDVLGLDITTHYKSQPFWRRFWPDHPAYRLEIDLLKVPHQFVNQALTCVLDRPKHIRCFYENQVVADGPIGKTITGKITLKVKVAQAPVGAVFEVKKLPMPSVMQKLSSVLTIEESGSKMHQNTGILTVTLKGPDPDELVATLNKIAATTQEKDTAKKAQEAAQTLSFLYQQLPITKAELEKAERALNHYRAKSGKIDLKLQAQFLLNQLADINKKEGELRIERIQMAQKYTNIHPAMQVVDAQFKALAQEERALREELRYLPESDQVAVTLMRDVKVKQALYRMLLKKIQELQVVKAGTVSSVRILANAKLPDAPLLSKKSMIYLSGLMLGFLMGCGVVFLRKLFRVRVDDPHWVERRFDLPNLATVPYCKEIVDKPRELSSTQAASLVAFTYPKSLAVESLRSLRTSIQVMLACASSNVISILGLSPGVGKSFVSANLAYLLAAGGKRVLLIDSDLRRGTLHKYFNLPASPGLADVLEGRQAFASAISVSREHERLSILSRGTYPSDPAELLMGPNLKVLVQHVSEAYDIVLFDSAPILLVTDAMVVAEHSVLNYLVVAAGVHQPNELELALKRLANAGVSVQGTVFNFHKDLGKKTSYYYGQYQKYAYYYHDENTAVQI